MDFGIARKEDHDGGGLTGTGQILGTPEYMSPEQARAEKVDVRSDVYALGVVVYEIFTGRVPFKGATPMATLFLHVQEPPPLDGPEAARIPAPVVSVLRKALAKVPGDRFGTAREMRTALLQARALALPGAAADDAAVFDASPTLSTPAPAPPPRSSPASAIAAVVLAGVALVLTFRSDWTSSLLTFLRPAATAPPPAPPPASPTAPPSVPPAAPASVGTEAASPPAPEATAWTEPLTLGVPSPASPGASPATASPEAGLLNLTVSPEADLLIDDQPAGAVPARPIVLAAGSHVLTLVHPDFEPLQRSVEVKPGETVDVRVDLLREGVPKNPAKK
jgi:serine/threonine-protein kinase